GKVSSSITASSVSRVGSRRKVSSIPARVQSRWVLSLRVRRFSSCSSCFSLCWAAISFFSAAAFWRLSFSSFSFMGSGSFLNNGQNKSDQLFTVDRLWLIHYSIIFFYRIETKHLLPNSL